MWLMILYGVIGYLVVGLLFTTGVFLYHRGSDSGFSFNPFPEWVLFIIAVVLFPFNMYWQYRDWKYRRDSQRKRLEEYENKRRNMK
ncbi:hypothetical protein ACFVS2_21025 [Brevibacillus sp. NPDC058079]|uniref:hypothetical protein n=1 Tax=Brevibacillus sp. NPDC058079 TaxID=3346330 RepID=UPI0036E562B8